MKFSEFCNAMFSILEREPTLVSETTNIKDDLDVDSLQMVNLVSSLADYYQISFSLFIEKADKIGTVGGLYSIVEEGSFSEPL